VAFTDTRYPITFVDGKPVRPEFDADQAAGKFPLGQVPVLKWDAETVAESRSIERFIAKKVHLFGRNDKETAHIDQVGEWVLDFRTAMRTATTAPEETKAAAIAKFWSEDAPKTISRLEHLLGSCGFGAHGHAVGGRLSLADVQIFSVFEFADQDKLGPILAASPKIASIIHTVANNAAVKHHQAARTTTPF